VIANHLVLIAAEDLKLANLVGIGVVAAATDDGLVVSAAVAVLPVTWSPVLTVPVPGDGAACGSLLPPLWAKMAMTATMNLPTPAMLPTTVQK